ncbi:right-handed parallel beta-helix repeat-containing protein, partial [bacterium]|nr:right-handed parallel beta-helix repeat-containing protein [bacterium]
MVGVSVDTVYVIGGRHTDGVLPGKLSDTMEAYNVRTGAWTSGFANIPQVTELQNSGYATLGDTIYIIGGNGGTGGAGTNFDTVWAYHIPTNAWSIFANYPTTINGIPTIAAGDTIYAFGGSNPGGASLKCYALNVKSKLWTTLPDIPFGGLSNIGIGIYGDTIFLFGGEDTVTGNASDTVFAFNTKTLTFDVTTSYALLPAKREALPKSNPTIGDSIYLIGGMGGPAAAEDPVRSVFIYHVPTNTWTNDATLISDSLYSHVTAAVDSGGVFHLVYFGGDTDQVNMQLRTGAVSVTAFPVPPADTPAAPSITYPSDLSGTTVLTINVRGTSQASSSEDTVRLYRNGVNVDTTTVSASDTWAFFNVSLTSNDTTSFVVRQTNDSGSTSDSSSAVRVIADTIAPLAPALVSPINNTTLTALSATFDWTDAADSPSGIADYYIQIDTDAAFASPFVFQAFRGSKTSDSVIGGLTAGLTHYWRVYAKDNAGNTSAYSGTETFVVPSVGTDTDILINEVLFKPGGTIDWNNDGSANAITDEFVELWNSGDGLVNIAGWRIDESDSAPPGMKIPASPSYYLAPKEFFVAYGSLAGFHYDKDGTLLDTVTLNGAWNGLDPGGGPATSLADSVGIWNASGQLKAHLSWLNGEDDGANDKSAAYFIDGWGTRYKNGAGDYEGAATPGKANSSDADTGPSNGYLDIIFNTTGDDTARVTVAVRDLNGAIMADFGDTAGYDAVYLTIGGVSATPDSIVYASTDNGTKTITLTGCTVGATLTARYKTTTKDAEAIPAPPWTGPKWYVNDTSTVGDSYTYNTGRDTVAGNGNVKYPWRTISQAMTKVAAGETIYIDAGIYSETVVISTDSVSLIGKDSSASGTILDRADSSSSADAAIYADTQTGLLIKNIRTYNYEYGIDWVNVDLSRIEDVWTQRSANFGIWLRNGSETNTVQYNTCTGHAHRGISLTTYSHNDTLANNVVYGSYGVVTGYGIYLDGAGAALRQTTISDNIVSNCIQYGIDISSANANTISNNTVEGNSDYGIILQGTSGNNVLTGNTIRDNQKTGVYITSIVSNCTITLNTNTNNRGDGFYDNGGANVYTRNISTNNRGSGFYFDLTSQPLRASHNLSSNNDTYGFYVKGSNVNFQQNSADSNASYQIYIAGASSSDTFQKNNIRSSPTNPDSGVYNGSTNATNKFTFSRNWWGDTDEAKIKAKIYQASNGDSVIWSPYRFGEVDTAAGADTTAPQVPAGSITLDTGTEGQITVTWALPNINEETNGGNVAFNGVKVYRLRNTPDTTHWANALVWTAGAADTSWVDTSVVWNDTYYYRLTARDTHTFVNESFFTDTRTTRTIRNVWYVNDSATAADSYTYAGGSDTAYGEGSKTKPFRTIPMAMSKAASGDTIYVDAGRYDSYVTVNGTETAGVNIDKDSIALIGKDSGATVIDPPGSGQPGGLYGIYADTQTGLLVKNLGVIGGAQNGIYFVNVDLSTISGDSVSTHSNGILFEAGSDSNTVTGNWSNSNADGISINSVSSTPSTNNRISGNIFSSNTNNGIRLGSWSGASTVIENNSIHSNGQSGILSVSTRATVIRNNEIRFNLLDGILLSAARAHTFIQNTLDSNAEYQIDISSTASSDTFQKNNIRTSPTNPDSGVAVTGGVATNLFTFTRNYWTATDSSRIRQMIYQASNGDSVIWQPFRLGAVDTAAGADTVAPKAPDTVAAVSIGGVNIRVTWRATDTHEEQMGGAWASSELGGYRVWRSAVADTSSWILVDTVSAATTSYDVGGLAGSTTYYFRVTAYDTATPFENQSFYSDSQPSAGTASSPKTWYVNDTSAAGDSYTYGLGSDTNAGDSPSLPVRTLIRAMALAKQYDTVLVDAGLYDSYTVVNSTETAGIHIDTDDLTIMGKDSATTIIDPVGGTTGQVYGIYADTQTKLLIKNFGIIGSNYGIYLVNVDQSTISSDSAASMGNNLVRLESGSESNTISHCFARNGAEGIYLGENCDGNSITNNVIASGSGGISLSASTNEPNGNTVSGNIITSANLSGIYLLRASGNTIKDNIVTSAVRRGIEISTNSRSNVVRNNRVIAGGWTGIELGSGADTNVIAQNDIAGADSGVVINANVRATTLAKNNITAIDINFILHTGGVAQTDMTRNWFGSADSAAISAKISDTSADWDPWRLAVVDTTAGADTTAPDGPDSVAVIGSPSDTSVILEWSAVTANEEVAAGAVALSGYRVYRSTVKDTSSWIKVTQVGSGTIRYQDTDVVLGGVYYYRVTAFDTAAPFENESFFSDSQPSDTVAFTSRINWYVNDTASAADSYTYAGGSDTSYGDGTASKPFRTIPMAMRFATAGDTIWVDAGFYDSYVNISATETAGVNITADSISLIGRDSGATVIDPPGDSSLANLYGIYADTQTGLTIKNMGVTGANYGIYFYNVDSSTIDGDSAGYCGKYGIFLSVYSDTNTLKNNIANWNGDRGIHLDSSSNNLVTGNTASSNKNYGIFLLYASDSNTVTNNTANSNVTGIWLSASSSNTVTGNTVNSNSFYGMLISGNSNNNTVAGNTANSNVFYGINLTGSSRNMLTGNTVNANLSRGIFLSAGSNGNTVVQNDVRQNTQYQIYIDGASSSDTVQKNNIATSSTNPDSGVYNASTVTTNKFTFTRNYWNSTDTGRIKQMIYQASNGDSVIWQPFRLGQVDTAAGADTTAPDGPDTVAVIGSPSDTSVILEWSAVTANEETMGGGVALSGYRVYRSAVKDTSSWVKVAERPAGTIRYQDTDVTLLTTYYYRVTAFDTAAFENESFFSDSQPSDSAQLFTTVNWYVNDTWTADDSYTYAGGSDTQTGSNIGTASKPFRTIPMAMRFATAGDTIWVDAGLYDSYVHINGLNTETAGVNIDKDSITLIGKDSGATVINPPGDSGTAGIYGVYADTQTGLRIRNLGVTGVREGIYLYNVDSSFVENDSASFCGQRGIYLVVRSETNVIRNNSTNWNGATGILLDGSPGNSLIGNAAHSNATFGLDLTNNSSNCAVTGNAADSNTYGIALDLNTDNTLQANTVSGNVTAGILVNASDNNIISANAAVTNTADGIVLQNTSRNNTLTGNTIISNSQHGLAVSGCQNNRIVQNEIRQNTQYQIYIDGASSSDTTQKNNIKPSAANPDSGVFNGSTNITNKFTFTRNYWNTTDDTKIRNQIYQASNGDSVIYSPFRLGQVDTAAGADTTAPGVPGNFTVADTTSTTVKLQWTVPTVTEETNGGSVGYAGFKIYRMVNTVDTTHWANTLYYTSSSTTDTQYTDTGVSAGNSYYYRITSRDTATFVNESFFADTQAATVTYIGPVWYLNDTYLSTDSFTYAGGSDTGGDGSKTKPYRTFGQVLANAAFGAGDTIYVDSGTYAETFVIDTDYIRIEGVDSISSVMDFGDSGTPTWAVGIFADTQTGLFIRNIRLRTYYKGIEWRGVTQSTIENVYLYQCGLYGVYLDDASNTNTLDRLMADEVDGNPHTVISYGIFIQTSTGNTVTNSVSRNTKGWTAGYGFGLDNADGNILTGNRAEGNESDGFSLFTGAADNRLTGNSAINNAQGFRLSTSHSNIFLRNVTANNTNYGVDISASNFNVFAQNSFGSDSDYSVRITGSSTGDTFEKNNFDTGILNSSTNAAARFSFVRNYWKTTDSLAIDAVIVQSSNGDSVIWQPFRLGAVDTAAGADTTAPDAPDTVAVVDADTSVVLEWSAVTGLEEANGGAVALSGYRVYRSRIKDTSSWIKIAQVGSGVIRFEDTDVGQDTTYYYRVTAFDTAGFTNESFFSDSQPEAVPWIGSNWYVNDTYTVADSYTYAGGSDTAGGVGSPSRPFRTIPMAMAKAAAGDTIWIDAGIFDSYVTVNATETAGVNIDKDSMTLIGKDSTATIIDPPGSKNLAALYGIYADTQTALTVKNLAVTGANDGIRFYNVDRSVITGDSVSSVGEYAVYLWTGSDTNTVSNNTFTSYSSDGILVRANSRFNTIRENLVEVGGIRGIYLLSGADYNTVTSNTLRSNTTGMELTSSLNNTILNNTARSNSSGFELSTSSNNNVLSGNVSDSNTTYGFYFQTTSNNNTCSGNTATANVSHGIYIDEASNNRFVRNLIQSNKQNGIRITGTVVASTNNVFIQNTLDSNVEYQIYLMRQALSDTFQKNNFRASPTNSDSVVYNSTNNTFDFTRNWWNTTDEVAIDRAIFDTAATKLITFGAYRLGIVDTTTGGDTTAPGLPASITLDTSVVDQITVTWTIPTVNEETNGGSVGYSGARVYRLTNLVDTTQWANSANLVRIASSTETTWADTGATGGKTYYYRLTSRDAATFVNESFFTDTKFATSLRRTNWYVNDTYTGADSFTYAGGSDTSYGDGSASKPYRSVAKAMQVVQAGDTVWVDAGLYTDTFVWVTATETAAFEIDTDNVAVIGKDSTATIFNPPDAKTLTTAYGIYADSQIGISIRNLCVQDAYIGIYFLNVDQSSISGDSLSSMGFDGLYLRNSETNSIKNCQMDDNATDGLAMIQGSHGNTVTSNSISANNDDGLVLSDSSSGNTISSNTIYDNAGNGVELVSGPSSNTFTSNTIDSNLNGVNFFTGGGFKFNVFRGNSASGNASYGFSLSITDSGTFTGNRVNSNVVAGFNLSASQMNVFVQNDVNANDTGIFIQTGFCLSNVIDKNNFGQNDVNHIYNKGGLIQSSGRNWFGSADSVTIKADISDTASDWDPWRLGAVDTASGADTTAPKAPDTAAVIDTTGGNIKLEWSAVTANEEAASGGVALSGYRVYRSRVKDTSSWTRIGSTGSATTQWTDTQTSNLGYYYRVTAFDTATPFENESFFSDSQPLDTAPAPAVAGPKTWYVNDTSAAGDSYTYGLGSDTNAGDSPSLPFRTIIQAVASASAGDTIYIDAGMYDSYVPVNSTDTAGVNITKDTLALIGVDSSATVINPPGVISAFTVYGIYADTQTGLLVKNIGVTNAYVGIEFYNVDRSTIESDSVSYCWSRGIELLYSDTNTVTKNRVRDAGTGINVESSSNNTISNNWSDSNQQAGIALVTASNNTLSGNRSDSNLTHGFDLNTTSSNNTLTDNIAESNAQVGLRLSTGTGNRLTSNTARLNGQHGIQLSGGSGLTVMRNVAVSNVQQGIYLSGSSDNTLTQNDARLNGLYQIYIDGAASSDTVQKNNIVTSATNPDSGLFNGSTAAGNKFTFTRNWWNSTDTGRIKQMIYQKSNGDSVIWQPFRLGQVDTAAGADTVAPKAPDTAAVLKSDTSVVLEWTAVTTKEEGTGGLGDLGGYRIYRSQVKDTASWIKIASLGNVIRYEDTTAVKGTTYYYRVTAFDTST